MEYRKLISFGKGGYVLSLPKEWVDHNRLEKGALMIIEKKGRALLVSPKGGEDQLNSHGDALVIQTQNKSAEVIRRQIRSGYLNNCSTMIVQGPDISSMYSEISDEVSRLVALEVVESSRERIVLKDFLDYTSVTPQRLIRKMDFLVRIMYREFAEQKSTLVKTIEESHIEISKCFMLLLKTFVKCSHEPTLMRLLGIKYIHVVKFWRRASSISAIADEFKYLAQTCDKVKDKQTHEEFSILVEKVEQHYLETMKILFKEEKDEAYNLASRRYELLDVLDEACEQKWKLRFLPMLTGSLRIIVMQQQQLIYSVIDG